MSRISYVRRHPPMSEKVNEIRRFVGSRPLGTGRDGYLLATFGYPRMTRSFGPMRTGCRCFPRAS